MGSIIIHTKTSFFTDPFDKYLFDEAMGYLYGGSDFWAKSIGGDGDGYEILKIQDMETGHIRNSLKMINRQDSGGCYRRVEAKYSAKIRELVDAKKKNLLAELNRRV